MESTPQWSPIELWRVKVFVNVWKLTLNWHVNCYSSLPWLHQMLLFRWFQGFQNRWWSVVAFLLSLLHLWLFVCECVCVWFIDKWGERWSYVEWVWVSLSLSLNYNFITVPVHLQVSKTSRSTLHYSHSHLLEPSKLSHVHTNYNSYIISHGNYRLRT